MGRNLRLILILTALVSLPAMAKGKKPSFKPGSDKTFKWKSLGINESRATGKPILLYVYENLKRNTRAEEFEKRIFPSDGVKAAFSGFLPVKIDNKSYTWPPGITQLGNKGAALLVMTCDAKPIVVFRSGNMPKKTRVGKKDTYPTVIAAAEAAKKRNPDALEAMKKSPPPKYVNRLYGQDLAANNKNVAEEKKEPEGVGGLLGGDDKGSGRKNGGKNAAAKKAEEERKKREAEARRLREDEDE